MGGGEDADVAEGAQVEQVAIAGDDEVGLSAERAGEDLGVVRIAAHRLGQGRRLEDLGEARVILRPGRQRRAPQPARAGGTWASFRVRPR